jgi:hypothetical protein
MDKKISELDAALALQAADVAPFVQSGANVKATTQQIITAVTGATGTNGETVTTSKPRLDLTQTWDAVGTTFTALKFNATDTASAAGSLLMDLQVGGASKFNVTKAGAITSAANFQANSGDKTNVAFALGAQNIGLYLRSGVVALSNAGAERFQIGSTSGIAFSGAGLNFAASGLDLSISGTDLTLARDAADTLAQRRTTSAQTFRLYGTFTDASNLRRLAVNMTTGGVASIKPEGLGTGASGNVLHISGLPQTNPGPGILWDDGGTVKVGT